MNLLLTALEYIERFLRIIDKKGNTVPLVLNDPQLRLYEVIKQQWNEGKPVRIIILKARQMGFSTLTEAIIFWMAATAFYVRCMIVAHTEDATNNLFLMSKRFYDNLPPALKPMQQASNAQELVFDKPSRSKAEGAGLGSRIRCATAGGKGVGRSFTVKALHLSEFAFWPGNKLETLTGLMQAVPDEAGTLIIIESTANGFDEFKKQWDSAVEAQREGREGFIPIFFAWHEMKEYRRTVPPGFVRTAEEEELAQTFNLDDEQLAWRRWCIQNNCGGDIDMFHQEYPSTPDEAFISTGRCVFDKQALVLRREQVRKYEWEYGSFAVEYDITGKIKSYRWRPEKQGPIRILKHPEECVPYVLGGDTAGTGTDQFVGQVLDNRTGEQVAVLHHQFGEKMYAEQMYCLGMYYNEALIGIETNYSTYPEMCLEELGYRNLYVRERYDNYSGKMKDAFGFETTTKSRPIIIDNLKDVALGAMEMITDYQTLGEMLTFVYDEKWKPQAEQGEHDDLVMALAIAHHIRSQQTTKLLQQTQRKVQKWTEDMWEDYNRASNEDREWMLRMWGAPN